MKIVCIADTQAHHEEIPLKEIPDGDILIVAGDFCGWGNIHEAELFNQWLKKLPHKHKIVVAGNHDLIFTEELDKKKILSNATYLQDEGITIDGVKFWGSPLNNTTIPTPFRAFHDDQVERAAMIPEGIDVLITHGPSAKYLDRTAFGVTAGSIPLLTRVLEVKPKHHVFGHIHEAYGRDVIEQEDEQGKFAIQLYNAALCDEYNNILNKDKTLLHKPLTIEI